MSVYSASFVDNDRLPIQPVAPPSLDYIPDSEEPHTPPVPQDEDEREPMTEPLPPIDLPTAESPGYEFDRGAGWRYDDGALLRDDADDEDKKTRGGG
ncbi:hypothetical protein Tco_0968289 [Tanacetum coccineum]